MRRRVPLWSTVPTAPGLLFSVHAPSSASAPFCHLGFFMCLFFARDCGSSSPGTLLLKESLGFRLGDYGLQNFLGPWCPHLELE